MISEVSVGQRKTFSTLSIVWVDPSAGQLFLLLSTETTFNNIN